MDEGRLDHLGLLSGCRSAHGGPRAGAGAGAAIAVGRAVVTAAAVVVVVVVVVVAVCVAVRKLRRVCGREVLSVCTRRAQAWGPHGRSRGRGRRNVHWVARGRQRGAGAGGGQDGDRPVHVRVVAVVARKWAPASLCD